jgi:hypothetical protein
MDSGMDVETTGGYRVPLDNWNDLANYLAMQRVKLTASFVTKLTILRSQEPEYRTFREEQGRAWRWIHETTEQHP